MKYNIVIKTIIVAVTVIFLNSFVYANSETNKKTLKSASLSDKTSYAIGYNICHQLKNDLKINTDLFLQGMKDNLANQPKMTGKEIKETMMAFQNMAMQKQMEKRKKESMENKASGQAFLDKNKTKDGIKTLPSGLQFKVIKTGKGDSPKLTDKVKCHYKGTLIDGTVFDSSYERKQPAVFPLNGVIKGWTQALQLMKPGAKWMLYLPSDLAYGDKGAGEIIKPGATLIFEVELLNIEK